MVQGGGGNVAVYLTSEGLILVDDMYDRDYASVMEQVRKLSNLPVRYVLNTHHHDDHAGANNSMPASVELISHKNARTQMLRLKQPGQPRLTFANEVARKSEPFTTAAATPTATSSSISRNSRPSTREIFS
jgi:glyoxylase-like metal-dependent hydrolase (beta-lactamase superfamily II)